MKPKQKILEFIQSAYEDQASGNPTAESSALSQEDRLAVREMFDGMSTGTARIIIEEDLDGQIAQSHKIEGLENKGRYYAARIVRTDGSLIRHLLVDKQSGSVHFTGR